MNCPHLWIYQPPADQIDAAINPGNSGGPAVADGKIVGLVYSKIVQGENIGYLLAADEVRMFLKTSIRRLPREAPALGLLPIGGKRSPPRSWDCTRKPAWW